ncbi:glutamyl-tRNA reductase [Polluticaenibacter yanchengensis]|uniref:Glutamyl-tRNA reductase n=1 Tax=Polluticaenibacter yanchengensis TaxID=3014562 RepID=A0ABT4UNN1_9BACT|nr:glutamyl-tRNA reductase [Chitinophagaceae bacterium LY-5]
MQLHAEHIIGRLCVAGINHTNATAEVRGKYSIDETAYNNILESARQMGLLSVFAISTCNRTEIYGYANHPHVLANLLVENTSGDFTTLQSSGYLHQGKNALNHLYKVACGLDSQIIGDFEIQGQLKQAYSHAQTHSMIGPIMDRTINFVFQASKRIRSSTALSTGTVSVSFAAIEWLQKNLDNSSKKLLLVGLGKFGTNVCKNIKHYLPQCSITVCNRTHKKTEKLAGIINAEVLPFEALEDKVNDYDVVVVCTNSQEPIIRKEFISRGARSKYFVDLSVPANIDPAIATLPDVVLANVDEISAITAFTIEKRLQEVPKAIDIIDHYIADFETWVKNYQHVPVIKMIKENLKHLSSIKSHKCEMAEVLGVNERPDVLIDHMNKELQVISNDILNDDAVITKTVSNLMVNLKTKKEKGCQFINAYNSFLNSNLNQ